MISHEPPNPETRTQAGLVIASARANAGLTTGQLADKLKLRETFITAIEDGRGEQHMVWAYERIHLQTISRTLNVSLDAIFESELEQNDK